MIEVKDHIGVQIIWAICIVGAGVLMFESVVTWQEGTAFLLALGLPSLFGKKQES